MNDIFVTRFFGSVQSALFRGSCAVQPEVLLSVKDLQCKHNHTID